MSKKIEIDFPGIKTSSVSHSMGDTGMTLLSLTGGGYGVVDVRGGSPGAREESSLSLNNDSGWVDAVCLVGGSTYGLEAASGVMRRIHQQRNFATDFNSIPAVPAACVYDFRARQTNHYPDIAMGEKAFDVLNGEFVEYGAVGAGTNVYIGKSDPNYLPEKAGIGAAFAIVDGIEVLMVTILNSFGSILDRQGNFLKGSRIYKENNSALVNQGGNTTISILAINADLDRPQLQRLAIMAHSSMARVIEPFHTPYDGDVLFAVRPLKAKPIFGNLVGFQAGVIRVVQDAVISGASDFD